MIIIIPYKPEKYGKHKFLLLLFGDYHQWHSCCLRKSKSEQTKEKRREEIQ